MLYPAELLAHTLFKLHKTTHLRHNQPFTSRFIFTSITAQFTTFFIKSAVKNAVKPKPVSNLYRLYKDLILLQEETEKLPAVKNDARYFPGANSRHPPAVKRCKNLPLKRKETLL
ncbi:MAG: hypothetical protein E3K32_11085 [wastewater metagenome]|nr:hypothetical protein [Candidatus Loosdrechtia aerotolerans]